MFIQHNGDNISFEQDKNSYSFNHLKIWYKGYFFYENKFYQTGEAASFFYTQYQNNKIETIIPLCNGIFTCVIIDEKTNGILIFNDRFGFGHLFYTAETGNFYISDNYWLLSKRSKKTTINKGSAYELMMFHYVLDEKTLIDGIYEIQPGSIYKFEPPVKSDFIKRSEYWKFKYNPTEQEADVEIYSTLKKIIDKYAKLVFNDSKIAINLTGGYDSRFLLSLMFQNNISTEKIEGYTYGLKNCEDIRISGNVAKITGIKHKVATFDDFIDDFFNENKIYEILKEIGFSAYYYQGYGPKSLEMMYTDTSYLLTGADGFYVGLAASKELFDISNKYELIDHIYKKNATFITADECNSILKESDPNLEKILKERISKAIPDDDYISAFYNWTFKNRIKKLNVSIHEIFNKKNIALYPFYDYEFIDLMARCSFNELSKQKAYYNALFRYALTGNLIKLRNLPADLRGKATFKNNNWVVSNTIKENLLLKIIRKILILPRRHFTYPTYRIFRFQKTKFFNKICPLFYEKSKLFDPEKVMQLIKRKKRAENFFVYGIPNIISVFAFEKLIDERIRHQD